jgi:hypothetical protein
VDTSGSFWGWLGTGIATAGIGLVLVFIPPAQVLGWTLVVIGTFCIGVGLWVGWRRMRKPRSVPNLPPLLKQEPTQRSGPALLRIAPGAVLEDSYVGENTVIGGDLIRNEGTIRKTPIVKNRVSSGPLDEPSIQATGPKTKRRRYRKRGT